MPQNKAYEDEEATSGLEDSRPANPTVATSGADGADESTALQEVSTYFSDEKILIPEPSRVSCSPANENTFDPNRRRLL